MNVVEWIDPRVSQVVGWTAISFLWEGLLVAAVLAPALACMRRAELRYAACVAAMLVMLVAPVVTAALLVDVMPALDRVGTGAAAEAALPLANAERSDHWLAWVACAWLAGVLVMAARFLFDLGCAIGLRRNGSQPASPYWQRQVADLAQRLGVKQTVLVLESVRARTPMVIGWLRPALLLPAAALTGLTPDQLRAVIAHELAHVRRHDYLVNLLQALFEGLLFFHPAVWWLSRRLRVEREFCCDDAAVNACGDALVYARALSLLADLRAAPTPAVASNGGSLMKRIRRLVDNKDGRQGGAALPAGLWLLSAALLFGWTGASFAKVGDGCCCCKSQPAKRAVLVQVGSEEASVLDDLRAEVERLMVEREDLRSQLESMHAHLQMKEDRRSAERQSVAAEMQRQRDAVEHERRLAEMHAAHAAHAVDARDAVAAAELAAVHEQADRELRAAHEQLAKREAELRARRASAADAMDELHDLDHQRRAKMEEELDRLMTHREQLHVHAQALKQKLHRAQAGETDAMDRSELHVRLADLHAAEADLQRLELEHRERLDQEQVHAHELHEEARRLATELKAVEMDRLRAEADARRVEIETERVHQRELAAAHAELLARHAEAVNTRDLDEHVRAALEAHMSALRASLKEEVAAGRLSKEAAEVLLEKLTDARKQ